MKESSGEKILWTDLEEEMKRLFLDYSMSVIVSRALPDVRDGLKPVHRRILYSMYEQKLTHKSRHKKSATVVGNVLGKYHPHSDSAVYDALVRMAQDFSLRNPLIDGQGNFGSIDGDPAAAYRYTEARMSKIGEELLKDIDKETVDFMPNFDQRLNEPVVLPASLPNLLMNGASGIAVGMATNIPPHNLVEVIKACRMKIDNPDVTDDEILEIIKGPDFPTGGIIQGTNGARKAYLTGKGKIVVCGRTRFEKTGRDRTAIIIDQIPYQVNKANLIKTIADLVRNKKIVDIADLRDESDREGMRIVVELRRDTIPEIVLNQLYKHTDLKCGFNANMLALVNNQPKILTLKEMLGHFIEHRHEIVLRRSNFELRKAAERAHILEGLLKALDRIDEVIETIRSSEDQNIAKVNLQEKFNLSEKQAQAILDMRLRRLTALDREEIHIEFNNLIGKIEYLRDLVSDNRKIMKVVSEELGEAAEKFGQPRVTEISLHEPEDFEMEDLIPDDEMVITLSRAGYIKRIPVDTYRLQHRGGKGITGASTRQEDILSQVFISSNHSYILFFTNLGKCYWLKVYRIPETGRTSKGQAIVNLLNLSPEERPVANVCMKNFDGERFILMASSTGMVKKTRIIDYSRPRKNGIIAINLLEGAELIGATVTDGKSEIILATRNGYANRFNEIEIRPMGRNTQGVKGIRVRDNDRVVSMVSADQAATLLTITENGYGKRSSISQYRKTHRGSSGVINIRNIERNGHVVVVKEVEQEDELILISAKGMVIRVPVEQTRVTGRNTQGVRIMNLPNNDKVVDAERLETADIETCEIKENGIKADEH